MNVNEFEGQVDLDGLLEPTQFEGSDVKSIKEIDDSHNDDQEYYEEDNEDVVDDEKDEREEDDEDLTAFQSFLKSKGIANGSTITFVEEDGTESSVEFDSLTKEEQLDVLNDLTSSGLSEDESTFLDALRSRNLKIDDFVESVKAKAIEDYLSKNPDAAPVKSYHIDEYSNDEIYLSHLKSIYSNLTDEELLEELDRAKEGGESFDKKVEAIRQDYINQEEEYERQKDELKAEQFRNFQDSLIKSADAWDELSLDFKDPKSDTLAISPEDKNKVLSHILDLDQNGKSKFFTELNNPDVLIKLAWYHLFGDEAFSEVSKYWKSMMKSERQPVRKRPTKANTHIDRSTKDDTKKDSPVGISRGVITPFDESYITN